MEFVELVCFFFCFFLFFCFFYHPVFKQIVIKFTIQGELKRTEYWERGKKLKKDENLPRVLVRVDG